MSNHSGRHVFAGLALALALTGCGPEADPASQETPSLGEHAQGVSVTPGYDITVRTGGQYTLRGYIMPRWTAPSAHSPTDWLGLYTSTETNDSSYLNFQHVATKGGTSGLGNAIRLPSTLPTTGSYQVRYLLSNAIDRAAYSTNFQVKATPTLACASARFEGSDLPTAHFVSLGKSTGQVQFSYQMYGTQDRIQVWTDDDQLLHDTGCVANARTLTLNSTNTLDGTYPNSRLLVVTLPMCNNNQQNRGTSLDWEIGCAQ